MKFYVSLFVSSFVLASSAFAALKFQDARIFAPMKGSTITAGYVSIQNEGPAEVELSLKKVEKFKAFETHETVEEAGKMAMRKVDSFKIPAKGSLELQPGGKHLMLFDPTEAIKEGSSIKVHFLVNKKEEIVDFKVVSRTESAAHH